MASRERTRPEIIDLLGRAADQAQHAEAYHAVAADPGTLEGRAAHQAARDAAAMQWIELAGCAEGFTRERGEPGTTLARLDDALRALFKTRTMHTHPENGLVPPPVSPRNLGEMMDRLQTAIGNLDSETLKFEPRDQVQALNEIFVGLTRIEKDGLPNPDALRPWDLHYAGYYREIQFGRLAKATGLFDSAGKALSVRELDVNGSIFAADNMAHTFHAMRKGADKSILPVSVVAAEHRNRMYGRALSELLRELRHEFQTPNERLVEIQSNAAAKERAEYRDAVQGLAETYVRLTGDRKAAAAVHDYVQRKEPRLERETINAMREALNLAEASDRYSELPEAIRMRCIDLCLVLAEHGDNRLLDILDAAEQRGAVRDRDMIAGGSEDDHTGGHDDDDEPGRDHHRSRGRGLSR
jgi:hypothetical protein